MRGTSPSLKPQEKGCWSVRGSHFGHHTYCWFQELAQEPRGGSGARNRGVEGTRLSHRNPGELAPEEASVGRNDGAVLSVPSAFLDPLVPRTSAWIPHATCAGGEGGGGPRLGGYAPAAHAGGGSHS